MSINYNSLDEGDTLDAASLNSRLLGLQQGVNDLQKVDIEERALRAEHLSTILRTTDMVPGPMKVSDTPDTETPTYTNLLSSPPNRNVVFIGSGAGVTGFSIISSRVGGIAIPGPFPGVATDCNISFSPSLNIVSAVSPLIGYSPTTYCTGLLVRLDVGLISQTSTNPQGVVIGIVWEDSPASYNYLNQSEACVSNQSGASNQLQYSNISTSALITAVDVGGASMVRVSGVIANMQAVANVTIREWTLSVIPIFGGSL